MSHCNGKAGNRESRENGKVFPAFPRFPRSQDSRSIPIPTFPIPTTITHTVDTSRLLDQRVDLSIRLVDLEQEYADAVTAIEVIEKQIEERDICQ